MLQKIQKKVKDFIAEKGQGTVEYALLLGVVAVIAFYLFNDNGVTKSAENAVKAAQTEAPKINNIYTAATHTT